MLIVSVLVSKTGTVPNARRPRSSKGPYLRLRPVESRHCFSAQVGSALTAHVQVSLRSAQVSSGAQAMSVLMPEVVQAQAFRSSMFQSPARQCPCQCSASDMLLCHRIVASASVFHVACPQTPHLFLCQRLCLCQPTPVLPAAALVSVPVPAALYQPACACAIVGACACVCACVPKHCQCQWCHSSSCRFDGISVCVDLLLAQSV
jgi:hypothetical protein